MQFVANRDGGTAGMNGEAIMHVLKAAKSTGTEVILSGLVIQLSSVDDCRTLSTTPTTRAELVVTKPKPVVMAHAVASTLSKQPNSTAAAAAEADLDTAATMPLSEVISALAVAASDGIKITSAVRSRRYATHAYIHTLCWPQAGVFVGHNPSQIMPSGADASLLRVCRWRRMAATVSGLRAIMHVVCTGCGAPMPDQPSIEAMSTAVVKCSSCVRAPDKNGRNMPLYDEIEEGDQESGVNNPVFQWLPAIALISAHPPAEPPGVAAKRKRAKAEDAANDAVSDVVAVQIAPAAVTSLLASISADLAASRIVSRLSGGGGKPFIASQVGTYAGTLQHSGISQDATSRFQQLAHLESLTAISHQGRQLTGSLKLKVEEAVPYLLHGACNAAMPQQFVVELLRDRKPVSEPQLGAQVSADASANLKMLIITGLQLVS
jgi:hypothetical protein